jgi:hypothetical protein
MPAWLGNAAPGRGRRVTRLSERRVPAPPTPSTPESMLERQRREADAILNTPDPEWDAQATHEQRQRKIREAAEEKRRMEQTEREKREQAARRQRETDDVMRSLEQEAIEEMLDAADATFKERDEVAAFQKLTLNPTLYHATVALQDVRAGRKAPNPAEASAWATAIVEAYRK